MKCQNCGIDFYGNFCPNCGAPASFQSNQPLQFGGQNTPIYDRKKMPLWGIFAIIISVIFLLFLFNSQIGTALGISCALGILMFAVSLVISLIKKQRKKANLIGLSVCLGLVIIAGNALPNGSSVPVSAVASAPSSQENVSLTPEEQKAYNEIQEKVESEIAESDNAIPMAVNYKTLHKEYMDNPIKADNKYKGRILTITGKIARIDREIAQNPYITFEVSPMYEMRMDFSKDDENVISNLKKGQTVTISGTCEGTLLSIDVVLDDCSVVS